ncbi:MAG: sugar phosphate nucleotidyltransferase [bacterium]
MRALIPVAGEGTRLKPHTNTYPKPLLYVAGKPIISHIVEILIDSGITEMVFITGYLEDKLKNFLLKNYDIPMKFVSQEKALGIAHAVYIARNIIKGEPVFIILGDTIFEADLHKVFSKGKNALGVMEVENPTRFGIVLVEDGRIVELEEKPLKPKSNLALTGLYFIKDTDILISCIDRLIKEERKTRNEYQITDALNEMVKGGSYITTFPLIGWYDCGCAQALIDTNRILLDRGGSEIRGTLRDTVVVDPVAVAEDVTIERSIIGPYVSIGSGTVITDSRIRDALIGRKNHIESVIIEKSLIGHETKIKGRFGNLNVGDSSELEMY